MAWIHNITFYKGSYVASYYGQLMVMDFMSIAFLDYYANSSLSNAFVEGVIHKPCHRT